MKPIRDIWRQLESFGVKWSPLEPFGAIWRHLKLFEAIRSYLELFGATVSHLELFGAIWGYLVLFRAIWSYWSYLELFGPFPFSFSSKFPTFLRDPRGAGQHEAFKFLSVRTSVRPYVRPSVRPSVFNSFSLLLLCQNTSDPQYFLQIPDPL